MAVFTRTNGNAQNVVSVGNIALSTEAASANVLISTGIGKPVQAFAVNSNISMTTQFGTGEGVETILRAIGLTTTLLAYQVGTANNGAVSNGLLSVLIEEANVTAAELQTSIRAATDSTYNTTGVVVTQPGLRLAE
jgi:N-acetylglutamate synthase/N-acetylornithine aminotransferase